MASPGHSKDLMAIMNLMTFNVGKMFAIDANASKGKRVMTTAFCGIGLGATVYAGGKLLWSGGKWAWNKIHKPAQPTAEQEQPAEQAAQAAPATK